MLMAQLDDERVDEQSAVRVLASRPVDCGDGRDGNMPNYRVLRVECDEREDAIASVYIAVVYIDLSDVAMSMDSGARGNGASCRRTLSAHSDSV
jgi:hypothetical protein